MNHHLRLTLQVARKAGPSHDWLQSRGLQLAKEGTADTFPAHKHFPLVRCAVILVCVSLAQEHTPCSVGNEAGGKSKDAKGKSMRYFIALVLLTSAVGCAPTMVTRTIATTTHADGTKEVVDTKTVTQSLSEVKPKCIQDVLEMQ